MGRPDEDPLRRARPEFAPEGLGRLFDEPIHLARMTGPSVLDRELPLDKKRHLGRADRVRQGRPDKVIIPAQRSSRKRPETVEQIVGDAGENFRETHEAGVQRSGGFGGRCGHGSPDVAHGTFPCKQR